MGSWNSNVSSCSYHGYNEPLCQLKASERWINLNSLFNSLLYCIHIAVKLWIRSRLTYATTSGPCRSGLKTDEMLAIQHVFSLDLTKKLSSPQPRPFIMLRCPAVHHQCGPLINTHCDTVLYSQDFSLHIHNYYSYTLFCRCWQRRCMLCGICACLDVFLSVGAVVFASLGFHVFRKCFSLWVVTRVRRQTRGFGCKKHIGLSH